MDCVVLCRVVLLCCISAVILMSVQSMVFAANVSYTAACTPAADVTRHAMSACMNACLNCQPPQLAAVERPATSH